MGNEMLDKSMKMDFAFDNHGWFGSAIRQDIAYRVIHNIINTYNLDVIGSLVITPIGYTRLGSSDFNITGSTAYCHSGSKYYFEGPYDNFNLGSIDTDKWTLGSSEYLIGSIYQNISFSGAPPAGGRYFELHGSTIGELGSIELWADSYGTTNNFVLNQGGSDTASKFYLGLFVIESGASNSVAKLQLSDGTNTVDLLSQTSAGSEEGFYELISNVSGSEIVIYKNGAHNSTVDVSTVGSDTTSGSWYLRPYILAADVGSAEQAITRMYVFGSMVNDINCHSRVEFSNRSIEGTTVIPYKPIWGTVGSDALDINHTIDYSISNGSWTNGSSYRMANLAAYTSLDVGLGMNGSVSIGSPSITEFDFTGGSFLYMYDDQQNLYHV